MDGPLRNPVVNLINAVKPSFTNLALGVNYLLQTSTDMNSWTNVGTFFTAINTSMVYPQYWDVENIGTICSFDCKLFNKPKL